MTQDDSPDVTASLNALSQGENVDAEQLVPLVYDQLRNLAAHMLTQESSGNTLQATALVNEAYLRLIDQSRVQWNGKSHFFAIGAKIMRRILVDHARGKKRQKRGGDWRRVLIEDDHQCSLQNDDDVLAIHEALEKLEQLDPLQAKIVELRFFAGMTVAEVAEALDLSKRKIEYEWAMIRAWLRRELSDGGAD